MTGNLIERYINKNDILFTTWNEGRKTSADLDIYVIAKQPAKSQVVMFYDQNNLWHEIFIDTEADLIKKLNNFDEISINFLLELDFAFGDEHAYNSYADRARKIGRQFNSYPARRLLVLKYRIKVLYSKYIDSSNDELTKRFLLNSLNYHVVNLFLLSNHILPSSPKRWITQLQSHFDKNENSRLQALINGSIDDKVLADLVKELTSDLQDMHIDKNRGDNSLTFIS